MSVFKFPKQVCKDISDVMAQFWWGDDNQGRKMHWYARWKLGFSKMRGGMGFRDLHSFNLALLSKQVWRLISEPDSLCAKVLQAKYYPNGNILTAGPKRGSSFTWQSIVEGIHLFKRGFIWRIGDEEKINIWTDPWIPSSPNRRVWSNRGAVLLTKVNDLIDPTTGTWDEELIQSIFDPIDVHRILSIPLNYQAFEDFIAWHGNRKGNFSVRSAHHLAWEHKFGMGNQQMDGLGTTTRNPVWKRLWQLGVPSKIKIFGWRALHGIIPRKAVMANRHIGNDGGCPVCIQGAEDILHLMFSCSRAKEVWKSLGILPFINHAVLVDRSGSAILEYILCHPEKKLPTTDLVGLQETILIAAWYIWWQRRKVVFEEAIAPANKTALSILMLARNYDQALKPVLEDGGPGWSKPPKSYVKLNVDAAYNDDANRGAIGAVLRDHTGHFCAATCVYVPHVISARMTEALAMQPGLLLAAHMGYNNVKAESDSTEVIAACTTNDQARSEETAIYMECSNLANSIGNVEFYHCNRSANEVAHTIARFSFDNRKDCNWVDEPPSFLLSTLLQDVTFVNHQYS